MSIHQVGTISDYTVIEAVGRTLASLLMTEMEDPVMVTISSPGEDYGVAVGSEGEELGTSRVNLFLYHVKEAPHSKNMDWVNIGDGNQITYPLSLQLYYMLNIFTPDKSSNLDEHRILGDVMRAFHANPIVDPIFFEGTLNPHEEPMGIPWEELNIMHHPLPLDELAAIWHAINKPYRLSVAYETSVSMIHPPTHSSRRVRRVDVTHVKAEPFTGKPSIDNIEPSACYSGDIVTINGENFGSPFLKVIFNGVQVTPDNITGGSITFSIPALTPPGLYWIEIINEQGRSGKVQLEEISPFLYRLDPEKKYTEDTDYPVNIDGDPELVILGGNFLTQPPTILELLAVPDTGAPSTILIAPENFTQNRIQWVIPPAMREGNTQITIRQDGTRLSNPLTLNIPRPQIFRADPEPISNLPQELIIMGDFFRTTPGDTQVYLHAGPLNDYGDLTPAELLTISVINENEIRTTLPVTTSDDTYLLVVMVYGNYYSPEFEITVAT